LYPGFLEDVVHRRLAADPVDVVAAFFPAPPELPDRSFTPDSPPVIFPFVQCKVFWRNFLFNPVALFDEVAVQWMTPVCVKPKGVAVVGNFV